MSPPKTLTSDPSSWHNSSLLSVTQITPSGLNLLHTTALSMRSLVNDPSPSPPLLSHSHILANVFYEASTRTSCSFHAAMFRLGGRVIHVDGDGNTSAKKKGETLSDTIRCLECYSDVTVLRHPIKGSVGEVAAETRKPVINAGDGVGEHPTQALLDLFTIRDELGLDGTDGRKSLIVVLVGDLKHGRTVHSLAKLLAASDGAGIGVDIDLRYCSPESLKMPEEVKEAVESIGAKGAVSVRQTEFTDLKEAMRDADVLYVTRIQKERFANESDYLEVEGSYVVDTDLMELAPPGMIVMHPLPRVNEISKEVDNDPRAAYFRQMENGMYVRMAILALILGKA